MLRAFQVRVTALEAELAATRAHAANLEARLSLLAPATSPGRLIVQAVAGFINDHPETDLNTFETELMEVIYGQANS